MSFNDFGPNAGKKPASRGSVTGSSPLRSGTASSDPAIDNLSRSLQEYQQNLAQFVQKVAECKKRKGGISVVEKRTLETQLTDLRSQEGRVLNSYNNLKDLVKDASSLSSRGVNVPLKDSRGNKETGGTTSSNGTVFNAPKLPSAPTLGGPAYSPSELATKRLALSKIGNDINRMTAQLQSTGNEVSLLTTTSYSSSDGPSGTGGGGSQQQLQQQQQLQFQALKGQDVDEMIMEERERDIKRINEDLVLVNELYKDMRDVVQSAQPKIDEIHKTTSDAAEHAKEGLEQVHKAAEYQPTCVVM